MESPSAPLKRSLPRTRSVGVSGLEMRFVGLKGYSWIAVFSAGLLLLLMFDSFPVALISSVAIYGFVRRFIDQKPAYWLVHALAWWLIVPRHYQHRPGRSRKVEKDLRDD